MTSEGLIQANNITKEIRELDLFISYAEKVWKGKLIKQTFKYIFKSVSYGVYDEVEYHMNTEMKGKFLNVLRDHLNDLKIQLSDM